MVTTDLAPTLSRTFEDYDPSHIVCRCTPDRALCGTSVDPDDELNDDDGPVDCIVCNDMDLAPCPRCNDERCDA